MSHIYPAALHSPFSLHRQTESHRELSPLPRKSRLSTSSRGILFSNRTTYQTCGFWIAWTSAADFCPAPALLVLLHHHTRPFSRSGFVLFDLQHLTTVTASITSPSTINSDRERRRRQQKTKRQYCLANKICSSVRVSARRQRLALVSSRRHPSSNSQHTRRLRLPATPISPR